MPNIDSTARTCIPIITGKGWVPWPSGSDLLCWHCSHAFSTVPVPAITRYHERAKLAEVCGNFCSWACAKRYMMTSGLQSGCTALYKLYSHAGGKGELVAAPPRETLACYGGHLTIDQFRTNTLHFQLCTMPFRIQMRELSALGYVKPSHRRKPPTAAPGNSVVAQAPSDTPCVTPPEKPKRKGALDTMFNNL